MAVPFQQQVMNGLKFQIMQSAIACNNETGRYGSAGGRLAQTEGEGEARSHT